jgi:dihydroxy-acid dehydratase
VPFICDLKPSGKYVMEDIHKVGGTPALLKYLMAKGFIDGSCLTVTGAAWGAAESVVWVLPNSYIHFH